MSGAHVAGCTTDDGCDTPWVTHAVDLWDTPWDTPWVTHAVDLC
jgi:hypothetical protein